MTELLLGVSADLLRRLGEADAALRIRSQFLELALAATTGKNLRLDDGALLRYSTFRTSSRRVQSRN